jgi:hypothetical protein
MRFGSAICVLLLVSVVLVAAADRAWQTGTWGTPPRDGTLLIESATETLTVSAPGDREQPALAARPGSAVQFAVQARTVYVLGPDKDEHALTLVERAPRHTTTYAALGGGHYVREVVGGKLVTLEDGSQWDIDPRVQFVVADWQPDDLISIRRSTDEPAFAFEIDNTSRDDGALANLRAR